MGDTATGLPWVASVTVGSDPLLPGAELAGTVLLNIAAESAATLPIKQIIVKIGHLSNGSNAILDNGEAQLTYTFDSTKLGDGETYIYVTAYDLNDNAATVKIPVTIANGISGTLPPAPAVVRVEAWTFAEPYGIKSAATSRFDLPPIRVR